MPMSRPRASASRSSFMCAKSWLAISTCPELAASSPVITIKSEDFPDPLGPTSATDCPSGTARSMPRKISTGPARLLRVSVTAFKSMTGEARLDGVPVVWLPETEGTCK